MSRLKRLSKDEVDPEVRELFARVGAARGNVPNMFRVYAHRPKILATMMAHLDAVTSSGTVPVRTKELVATLVSRLNTCNYCNSSHTRLAEREGASAEQMQRLLDFESGPFNEAEKAALAWAYQMTVDSQRVDDALFDRLRAHYDDGQIVEISAMAGLFNYFNRFNNALGMEPTKPGEGL